MKPTQEQVIAWAREAGISTPWDQEPVPWKLLTGFATLAYEAGSMDEREWQTLTDEEITACIQMGKSGYLDGFVKPLATSRAVEAKLKEKNGF
jgi:hypothetical protein